MNVKDVKIEVNWKGVVADKMKNEFLQYVCFLFKEIITDKKCLNDTINFRVNCGDKITIIVPVADVIDFIEKEKK